MNQDEIMDIPSEVYLPNNIKRYETKLGILYIAPEIASAILVDDVGDFLINQLVRNPSIDEAFYSVVKFYNNKYNESYIYTKFIRLIGQMNIEQFSSDTKALNLNFDKIEKGVHIYLTQRCNLSCIHCYNSYEDEPVREVTLDMFKEAVDFFSPYVINYNFSGGEPMLSPYFFPLAQYIKDRYPEKSLTLYTNGTLIDSQEKAHKIACLFSEIQVSVDGASEDTVNFIRGKGAFHKIKCALEYLAREDIEELAIAICLFKKNIDDLSDNLLNLLEAVDPQKKIKSIRFADIEIEGRAGIDMVYEKNEENVTKITNLQKEINLSGRRIWVRYEEISFRNYFYFNKEPVRRISTTCSFGQSIVFDANGDLYPCAIKQPDSILGNFYNEDFRKELICEWEHCFSNHTVDNMSPCKSCDIRYFCCGECRLSHRKKTGSYSLPSCDEDYKNEKIYSIAKKIAHNFSIETLEVLSLDSTI